MIVDVTVGVIVGVFVGVGDINVNENVSTEIAFPPVQQYCLILKYHIPVVLPISIF